MRFEDLPREEKAKALRAAKGEVLKEFEPGAPQFVAAVLFDQLIRDAEDGLTEPTPLTRDAIKDAVERDFPGQATPSGLEAGPTRVAEVLKDFVFRYPEDNPQWQLRFAGPTASGRKGSKARSAYHYLICKAIPVQQANPIPPEPASTIRDDEGTATSNVETAPDAGPSTKRRPLYRRRSIVVLLVAALLIAISAVLASRWNLSKPIAAGRRAASPAPPKQGEPSLRNSIAVLRLRNNTHDPNAEWLASAVPEMLAANLALNPTLRVARPEAIAQMTHDLSITDRDTFDHETLARIQGTLHVESLVIGSYDAIGQPGSGLLEINLQIIDAATGRVRVKCPPASGRSDRIFDIVRDAAAALREQATLGGLAPEQIAPWKAAYNYKQEALRLYAQGTERFRAHDALGARNLLAQATQADSSFPLAHFALTQVDSWLGDTTDAIAESDRAISLSGGITPELKQEFQAHALSARFDRDKAADEYLKLSTSFPNRLDYALLAIRQLQDNNEPDKALLAVHNLRRMLPPPMSNDARIDLAESTALQDSNASAQKQFAISSESAARVIGARSIVGAALLLRAGAERDLGHIPAMTDDVAAAEQIFDELGDSANYGRAIEIAAAAADVSDLEKERRLLEQALGYHNRTGEKRSIARVTLNIGTILVFQGHNAEGEQLIKRAKGVFTNLHDDNAIAAAFASTGTRMFNHGDILPAQSQYKEALNYYDAAHTLQRGITKGNIAEVSECLGRLDEALSIFKEAAAIHTTGHNNAELAYDLGRIGEVLMLKGNLAGAKDSYAEALKIQERADVADKIGANQSKIALAGIAIEQGESINERDLKTAQQILEAGDAADASLLSLGIIAEYLLRQNRLSEAVDVAKRLDALASKVKYERIHLSVAVTSARVRAASGKREDAEAAIQQLKDTATEAVHHSFITSEFDAELARAEIEAAHQQQDARKHLLDLAGRAHQYGFGYIEERANRAASKARQ